MKPWCCDGASMSLCGAHGVINVFFASHINNDILMSLSTFMESCVLQNALSRLCAVLDMLLCCFALCHVTF